MENLTEVSTKQHIYTVSQLNREVRDFLEGSFPPIWVSGEISNFACPSSGHWYFSLKDSTASVRCAMFQTRNKAINFKPANGLQVLLRARISLYENRGEYQLIADFIEPAGDGLLQKAFEELKRRLSAEGLFAEEHKKAIPVFPQTIGVITSPTGAAIHDILSVFHRRYPLIKIIIYPTSVQGNLAAGEIVQALKIANQRQECDVLILARGGGSLEDLWPFNEESVARAIYNSELPIISAVGHEIDFTIADFVADKRAPTPSAAAELVSPDQKELFYQLNKFHQRTIFCVTQLIQQRQQQLQHLIQRLRHPKQRLQEQEQVLDNLEQRLQRAMQQQYQQAQQLLTHLAHTLHTLSPLATLDRGYAILFKKNLQHIISITKEVSPGEKIIARIRDGEIYCSVDAISDL